MFDDVIVRLRRGEIMRIFLVGNGFDLYHMLPTKYENFLHTVNFLMNNYHTSMKRISDVFENEELQRQDKLISDSYKMYSEGYKCVCLDKEKVEKILKLAKDKYWFSYFLKSYNKDLGWIDFEKEIATVINNIERFLKTRINRFPIYDMSIKNSSGFNLDPIFGNIVNHFDYYYERMPENYNQAIVIPEDRIEVPFGTENFFINKSKVIDQLYNYLRDLAEMLKLYLEIFVDNATQTFVDLGLFKEKDLFHKNDQVISFNYTYTFEKVYQPTSNVIHIHGSILNNIVLGVNSDSRDELEKIDTSFIKFKKYYQRVFLKTDKEYLEKIDALKCLSKFDNGNVLYVVGHSLDVTDKEIIKELFDISRKIKVFYHDESAVGQHITNLVTIYGKEQFDLLRTKKNLTFEKL